MTERDRPAERGEGVLARWSRLKRARPERSEAASADDPRPDEAPTIASGPAVPGPAGPGPAVPVPAVPVPAVEASEAAGAIRIEDLPDIESLTYEFDFTVFLAKGVPQALRSRALKKLWRSDPILANLDGLNDHDLDYRHIGLKTLAARSLEDLARGTKRLTASDRAAEQPARSRQLTDRPAAAAAGDQVATTPGAATPTESDPPATTGSTASSTSDPPATTGRAGSSTSDPDAV